MKILNFPSEDYQFHEATKTYRIKQNDIGLLELLWTGINFCPKSLETSKEHRQNKKIKNLIKTVTRFKDSDEDSRISNEGPQSLCIEDADLEFLKGRLEAASKIFGSKISEEVSELWEVIESAQDFVPGVIRELKLEG